jgi:YHS domain-containing protein
METEKGKTPSRAVDPVCNNEIPETAAELQTVYESRTYRFCCPGCKREFDANPKLYAAGSKKKKHGGFWSRYLKRLNKSTGGKPQCCH